MRSFSGPVSLALLFLLAFSLAVNAKAPKVLDLNDTIAANPILTKFAALVQAADMGTFLSSRGPLTVFAPTDSAFSKLPPGTIDSLLLPQNKEALQRLILYHIFSGQSTSSKDLAPLKTLISAEGQPWVIKKGRTGTQYVQKAKITHADIHCLNGVLHQVDTVLVPADSPLSSLGTDTGPVVAPVVPTNAAPEAVVPPPPPESVPTPLQTNAPAEKTSD